MKEHSNNIFERGQIDEAVSKEIWMPIKGYEGIYEISSKARVKALEKTVVGGRYNCPRLFKEKILKDCRGNVSLQKNKIKKTYDVYTLKQMHFNGFKPNGKRKKVIKDDQIITRRKFVQEIKSKKKDKTSKYVGVSWHKTAKKWRAAILINTVDIHLGLFEIEIEAKIMYEKAVKNIHLYKGLPKYFRAMLNEVYWSDVKEVKKQKVIL